MENPSKGRRTPCRSLIFPRGHTVQLMVTDDSGLRCLWQALLSPSGICHVLDSIVPRKPQAQVSISCVMWAPRLWIQMGIGDVYHHLVTVGSVWRPTCLNDFLEPLYPLRKPKMRTVEMQCCRVRWRVDTCGCGGTRSIWWQEPDIAFLGV